MSDEELAAIRKRYEMLDKLARYANVAATVPEAAHLLEMTHEQGESILVIQQQILAEDVPALLAEVEHQRAENAALRESMQAIADEARRSSKTGFVSITYLVRLIEKARALLASK